MSNLFYVVLIVAVVIVGDTVQKYFKMKTKEREQSDPELEETLAQIERLEDRIRVLERIVTESRHDLRSEIDRLE